ncbi:radical SAM protein [Ferrimonas balearica]|uniref:radical SAM protein n=1 Tax=Ferrimonas balearica TaxID=44012 RepID=UPI001C999E52|nr:radical SAM protein [Ferrimonas balearica]MBY5991440.1 radical SAM protein [Ferrimonas balearica]
MRYQGKVYRPWPEANSLLIQATLGCSNNQCTFCTMFDDKRFKIREMDDIFADIESARARYSEVRSIFFIDGNVMAMRTELLLAILNKITTTFPECERIALYSCLNDLRRKSDEDLAALKAAGVSMIYAGLESGDPLVLEKIKKGMTAEQARDGMAKAKKAGIEVLLSFIFGLGGKDRSEAHIQATTALLNELKPEQIAPMALAVQPGSELAQEVARGEFLLPTPLQLLEEERHLLANLKFDTFYWGDHGNNVLSMKGWLPEQQPTFLARVEHAMAHHPIAQQNRLLTQPW